MDIAQTEIQKTREAIDKAGRDFIDRISAESSISVPVTRQVWAKLPNREISEQLSITDANGSDFKRRKAVGQY